MPSERKESPSSQHSVESAESTSKVGSDSSGSSGEGGRGTPVKPPEKQGTSGSSNTPRSTTDSPVPRPDSATANAGRKAALPTVKRAFKDEDSPASSTSDVSRHTRHVAMSRMSINSLTSSSQGTQSMGSCATLHTARPDVEIVFVEELEKHHECPVCGQVLRYPVQFECKHHCCSSCLSELLRVEPRCPIDQSKIERDKVTVDKGLQKVLECLAVWCSNREEGCEWSKHLKDLIPHLADCGYTTIPCPNECDAAFQRRFKEKHVTDDCPRRPISCVHCRRPLLSEEETDHLETCTRLPILCPNGCKHKEMPRNEVPHHIATKCTREQVTCSFMSLGCDHKCIRKELTDHNKLQADTHMSLVAEALTSYRRTFDQQAGVMQRQTENLARVEVRVESLEKLYGAQLVWRIDNYAQRHDEAVTGKRTTVYSPPFYTTRHGYKMIASACLNGDGKSRGKHMSLFICICRGDYDTILSWPFSQRISFSLIDQALDPAARRNVTYSVKPNICKENRAFLGRPTTDRNASFGSQRFVELDMLNARDYVRDDTMFIKVVIDNEEMEAV